MKSGNEDGGLRRSWDILACDSLFVYLSATCHVEESRSLIRRFGRRLCSSIPSSDTVNDSPVVAATTSPCSCKSNTATSPMELDFRTWRRLIGCRERQMRRLGSWLRLACGWTYCLKNLKINNPKLYLWPIDKLITWTFNKWLRFKFNFILLLKSQ